MSDDSTTAEDLVNDWDGLDDLSAKDNPTPDLAQMFKIVVFGGIMSIVYAVASTIRRAAVEVGEFFGIVTDNLANLMSYLGDRVRQTGAIIDTVGAWVGAGWTGPLDPAPGFVDILQQSIGKTILWIGNQPAYLAGLMALLLVASVWALAAGLRRVV